MAASPGLSWVYILSCCVISSQCFNIDIENIHIFKGENPDSYFGFSSALTKNGDNTWLLVGAPRDNSSLPPVIPRSGNLYRCAINFTGSKTTTCSVVYNAIRGEPKRRLYEQENQLFGGNIHIYGNEDKYVACAPQQKRIYEASTTGFVYIVGTCSIGDVNDPGLAAQTNVLRLTPMFDSKSWHWGAAMLGFSYTPIDYPVYQGVMGGPGIYGGKGGFVLISTSDVRKYKHYSIENNKNLDDAFMPGSYLGYALTAGKFGTDRDRRIEFLVASAPHFSNTEDGHVGIVLLILPMNSGNSFQDKKSFTGTQPGAGFGASLVVSDINGDGLDDLLVGSPYFTGKNTDEGLVDVFYGTGDSQFLNPTLIKLRGLSKRKARFGTALSALGDINNDGYNDVAIGAPYEDEQRGAVYVYNGNKGDLDTQYSQRIAATELDNDLRGFGFHISKALDIDSNSYNDISVGSYLSDRTVLLRSRPIVRLDSNMLLSPPVLLLNSSGLDCQRTPDDLSPCVTVVLCFNFSGRGVDSGINIDFTLKADTDRTENRKTSRIQLLDSEGYISDQITETFHLSVKDHLNCKRITARVPAISRQFFQVIGHPIVFKANYTLSLDPVPGQVFPILDKNTIQLVQVQGNISNGCSGGICRADLQLEADLSDTSVIVGHTKEVSVKVHVRNLGNPAYGASVKLTSSPNAVYTDSIIADRSVLVVCNSTLQRLTGISDVVCEYERPFFKQQITEFQSRFNVSSEHILTAGVSLNSLMEYVVLNITTDVRMPSVDEANILTKKLDVKLLSDIEITSSSDPDQVKVSNSKDGTASFTHTYEVYNKGPSPLPPSLLVIKIPVQAKNRSHHNVGFEPANRCRFVEFGPAAPYGANLLMEPVHLIKRSAQSTSDSQTGKQTVHSSAQRDAPESQTSKRTVKDMTCTDFECTYVECRMDLLEREKFFTVRVHVNLSESQLKFEKDVLGIRYFTNATVHPPQHPLFIPWQTVQSGSVKIDIYPGTVTVTTEKIEIWIIIVGCVGGFLLFLLLGVILWKCGFFKRTKREKVQDWKRKSGYNQRRSEHVATRRQGGSSVKAKVASTSSPDWVEERNSKGFE